MCRRMCQQTCMAVLQKKSMEVHGPPDAVAHELEASRGSDELVKLLLKKSAELEATFLREDGAVVDVDADASLRDLVLDALDPPAGDSRKDEHRRRASLENAGGGNDRLVGDGAVNFEPAKVALIESTEEVAEGLGRS